MSKKCFQLCGALAAAALLVGCGATRVSYSGAALPAFLIDEQVTMVSENNVWRLQGGSDAVSYFTPAQAQQAIGSYQRDCDTAVSSAVLSLGTSLVSCGVKVALSNARGIPDWTDYRKILRLGDKKEVPHYRVQIQAEGRQYHGLLVFNAIPEEAGTSAPRSYQVSIRAGGGDLPAFGNVRTTYGYYKIPKYPEVRFASWMLWYSDIPLR